MILKIQRPLGGDMTRCCVYNHDRTVFGDLPYTPEIARLFGKDEQEFRVYVHASIQTDGTVYIDSVIGHDKLF